MSVVAKYKNKYVLNCVKKKKTIVFEKYKNPPNQIYYFNLKNL